MKLVPIEEEHAPYLRDESRRTGAAAWLAFVETEAEAAQALAEAGARQMPATIQGARTGITAGAVPAGGLVINLERMNRVLGLRADAQGFLLRVQPGLRLAELRAMLAGATFETSGWTAASRAALAQLQQAGPHFFAPDPTEASASLGGMISCNASGALSYHYGPTRAHVASLHILTAAGERLRLARGAPKAHGLDFQLTADNGRLYAGRIPAYRMPEVKNASGYYAAADMDLLDLFIGAEGTLGLVTEAELRLQPRPACTWGLAAFLPEEEAALDFVAQVRSGLQAGGPDAFLAALEFFDARALRLIRQRQQTDPGALAIPALPAGDPACVYVEIHARHEAAAEAAFERLSRLLTACGGSEDACWAAMDEKEMDKLKTLRHAAPETVNTLIDERRRTHPELTKLGTDMSVPDRHLAGTLHMYHEDLAGAGLEYVVFGHIGNNHLHVNIIPRDMAEYGQGRALYAKWARAVVSMGGSISAEHGVGKLKTAMLEQMYGPGAIAEMKNLKRVFDPDWRLNPGNLFAAP